MDLLTLAAFAANPCIGPRRFRSVRDAFPDVSDFLDLPANDQMRFFRMNPDQEENRRFFDGMKTDAARILDICGKKSIRLISADDPEYPDRLRTIPDAPFALFVIGRLRPDKCIAVVGTRQATPDAVAVNEYFSRSFAAHGLGIVSGLALGHDGIAQNIAVENGGYTVAVLGSGIDVIYPPEYADLYGRVAATGAIVSEYAPGAAGLPFQFPLRNRIISGLSEAVLVVQAPVKSGALITARYAGEQGRDLYAVPGHPTEPMNAGSNLLIQNGAKLALRPEDIIRDILGNQVQVRIVQPSAPETARRPAADLSDEERKILSLLSGETYIDDLADRSGMGIGRLMHVLTAMELKGVITQYPGRIYGKGPVN